MLKFQNNCYYIYHVGDVYIKTLKMKRSGADNLACACKRKKQTGIGRPAARARVFNSNTAEMEPAPVEEEMEWYPLPEVWGDDGGSAGDGTRSTPTVGASGKGEGPLESRAASCSRIPSSLQRRPPSFPRPPVRLPFASPGPLLTRQSPLTLSRPPRP